MERSCPHIPAGTPPDSAVSCEPCRGLWAAPPHARGPAGPRETDGHSPMADAPWSRVHQPPCSDSAVLSPLARLPCFNPLSKPSLVSMATYWGSSVTTGTWLLGLNTPYHHSIKEYGERGRWVAKETEFRASPQERLGKEALWDF